MTELLPAPTTTGLPTLAIERPPTSVEIERWQRLLAEHQRASNAVDSAALLLENIYTTWKFGSDNKITLPHFDPDLEKKFFDIKELFEQSKKAIRMVIDHKLGIRTSGINDLDIVEPSPQALGGLIIPVIIGAVILASAIAVAIYQSRIATEIANAYRKLLFDTNKIFCTDPKSAICKKWQSYKKARKYEQNINLSNSLTNALKGGVKTVVSGLATGLLVAIGLAVFLRSR